MCFEKSFVRRIGRAEIKMRITKVVVGSISIDEIREEVVLVQSHFDAESVGLHHRERNVARRSFRALMFTVRGDKFLATDCLAHIRSERKTPRLCV